MKIEHFKTNIDFSQFWPFVGKINRLFLQILLTTGSFFGTKVPKRREWLKLFMLHTHAKVAYYQKVSYFREPLFKSRIHNSLIVKTKLISTEFDYGMQFEILCPCSKKLCFYKVTIIWVPNCSFDIQMCPIVHMSYKFFMESVVIFIVLFNSILIKYKNNKMKIQILTCMQWNPRWWL